MIAAALADRQVTPAQFEMEKIMDPTIRAQLKKVEVVADPEIEKVFPALQRVIVNITTTDGRNSRNNWTTRKEIRAIRSAMPRSKRSFQRWPKGSCRGSAEKAHGRDLEPGEDRLGIEADGDDEGGCAKKEVSIRRNQAEGESKNQKAEWLAMHLNIGEFCQPAQVLAPVLAWFVSVPLGNGDPMRQTIVEKIAQTHMAEGPKRPLRTGDFLSIRPASRHDA